MTVKSKKSRNTRQGANHAKKEQFLAKNGSVAQLLGEVITWKPGGNRTHKEVVDALTAAGLDPKVARELLPRHAFSRASRKLADERVIDGLNEDDVDITFQFTKKTMDKHAKEWKYNKETMLVLNKVTGKVTCENKDLEQHAQREVDRCMEARTTNDISKIIQKLFEQNADLFSIRDQGGVYVVPNEHRAFADKVEQFLEHLGGCLTRFPIQAGTTSGDRSMQAAVTDGLAEVIGEYEEAVEDFGTDTRGTTLDKMADAIKSTRLKVEAYAHYLHEERERLLTALETTELKLVAKVEALSKQRAEEVAKNGEVKHRQDIFGFAIVRVLRWMGKNNWTFTEAEKVLNALDIDHAEATIRINLRWGRVGKGSPPAELSKEQERKLEAMRAK